MRLGESEVTTGTGLVPLPWTTRETLPVKTPPPVFVTVKFRSAKPPTTTLLNPSEPGMTPIADVVLFRRTERVSPLTSATARSGFPSSLVSAGP